jgi:hypothetical protein
MAESTIGKGFESYVQNQITTRQQIAGSGVTSEYPDSVIKYNNSKTSWLRLTSGVNVGSSEALATQYVLGGGTNFADTYAGVGYNSTSAYGFRSNKDYGYVPIPGITSAQVKSLNRGSLREAKIEIKCHNLEQFKDIEKVFLKLQYSMLLEWGHSCYFNNKNEFIENPNHNLSTYFLTSHTQREILTKIEDERIKSCGNYDAFFGFVKNFSWSLRADGGYDITLDLVSAGSIIESLKINVNLPKNSTPDFSTDVNLQDFPPYYNSRFSSTLNQILDDISKKLYIPDPNTFFNAKNGFAELSPSSIESTSGFKVNYIDPNVAETSGPNAIYAEQEGVGIRDYFLSEKWKDNSSFNGTPGGQHFYIKLGELLKIMESFLLLYNTSKGGSKSHPPQFFIDHNYDDNYCLTIPRQSSSNPKVCIIDPADDPGGASISETVAAPATLGWKEETQYYSFLWAEFFSNASSTKNYIPYATRQRNEQLEGLTSANPINWQGGVLGSRGKVNYQFYATESIVSTAPVNNVTVDSSFVGLWDTSAGFHDNIFDEILAGGYSLAANQNNVLPPDGGTAYGGPNGGTIGYGIRYQQLIDTYRQNGEGANSVLEPFVTQSWYLTEVFSEPAPIQIPFPFDKTKPVTWLKITNFSIKDISYFEVAPSSFLTAETPPAGRDILFTWFGPLAVEESSGEAANQGVDRNTAVFDKNKAKAIFDNIVGADYNTGWDVYDGQQIAIWGLNSNSAGGAIGNLSTFTGTPYAFPKVYKITYKFQKWTNANFNASTVYTTTGAKIFQDIKDLYRVSSTPWAGRFMHILVNFNHISETLKRNLDEEGNISVYQFLTQLMRGIQKSLGNINNFEIIFNESTNTLRIIDNTMIPGLLKNPTISSFNVGTLFGNYGSFVNNVSIKSELSGKFASIATVGAQANGNTVGIDATFLSKWNTFDKITDRHVTRKTNENTPPPGQTPEELYKLNLFAFNQYLAKVNSCVVSDVDVASVTDIMTDILRYEIALATNNDDIPGIGFIPINLQLDVEGLSGMKIYDTYTIDTSILPKSYQNKIQFVTKGVSHKIDSNGWTTSLESIVGPKNNNVAIRDPKKVVWEDLKIDVNVVSNNTGGNTGGSTSPKTGGKGSGKSTCKKSPPPGYVCVNSNLSSQNYKLLGWPIKGVYEDDGDWFAPYTSEKNGTTNFEMDPTYAANLTKITYQFTQGGKKGEYAFKGSSLHKDFLNPLLKALKAVDDAGLSGYWYTGGIVSSRTKRGSGGDGGTGKNSLSTHAWALAVDINNSFPKGGYGFNIPDTKEYYLDLNDPKRPNHFYAKVNDIMRQSGLQQLSSNTPPDYGGYDPMHLVCPGYPCV